MLITLKLCPAGNSWVQMRTVAMCFSLLQFPRCRIHTLASAWWDRFQYSSGRYGEGSSSKVFCTNKYDPEGGYSRRWIRRNVTTETEGKHKESVLSKTSIKHELADETTSTSINIYKSEITEVERTQYYDIQQKIVEKKDVAKLATFIVFDIETTGFSKEKERIIEIALQDLRGGENSTFQTLVNPGRYVPNSHIHGISTHMVNRPDVPRMEELIPILLQYISSRQKPGGYVVWVAHNARTFDVPFLSNEFNRYSYEIPSNWLFIDTLPLAREVMKSGGLKVPSRVSLQALRDHYEIPLIGSAHRAMSDVSVLSLIFQRLTYDLKLPIPGLIDKHSFSASESSSSKKKKKNSG